MAVKLSGTDETEEPTSIHRSVTPVQISESDPIQAWIKIEQSWLQVQPARYSPFGIEFINPGQVRINKGTKLELKIRLGKDENVFSGLVVQDVYKKDDQLLVGVRTFRPTNTKDLQGDRRATQRWQCIDDFIPRGRAANPIAYNDFIIFKIDNISAGGVRLVTSLRNKFLGIGQRLDATISLPLIGSVQATIVIRTIDTRRDSEGKDHLLLGAQFIQKDEIFQASVAEYLLNFGESVTVASLKKDGFPVKAISQWLDFTYVKNEDEYNAVLNLRLAAYRSAKKVTEEATPRDMSDEFDANSRILIVKDKGAVIGSLRAMFHESWEESDIGRYTKYPSDFPKPKECVESTRVCTNPSYRGSDILHQLMAHLVLLTVKNGRRYIVGGASGSLIKVYDDLGFRSRGIRYYSQALGGLEHEIIVMDTHEVALGRGINYSTWTKVYSQVSKYMIEQELILPSSADLIKMRFNDFLSLLSVKRR